jgi:hypothetical protein
MICRYMISYSYGHIESVKQASLNACTGVAYKGIYMASVTGNCRHVCVARITDKFEVSVGSVLTVKSSLYSW